jgi:hypothetical protein
MTRPSAAAGMFALLGFAAVAAGQDGTPRTIPPPPASGGRPVPGEQRDRAAPGPEEAARSRRAIAEAYRYKGTTVVASKGLDADPEHWGRISKLLSGADFVPEQRKRRFAGLPPFFSIIGWHLTVEKLEVRGDDTFVRVRAAPIPRAHGGGIAGVMDFYREDYRIAGGKLHFLGSEPIPEDLSVSHSVQ